MKVDFSERGEMGLLLWGKRRFNREVTGLSSGAQLTYFCPNSGSLAI